MDSFETVAPAFVEMAHRIVWATAATVNGAGEPITRILHPIWEWDGRTLSGRIATSPLSPKAKHLDRMPIMSITYWQPSHDTCTVRCSTSWDATEAGSEALWQAFKDAPDPLGYDPAIIPGWDTPNSPSFGVLELEPIAISVRDGGFGHPPLVWRR